MAKQIIRALVALLATSILTACSSTPWQNQLSSNDNVAKPATGTVTVSAPAPAKPAPAPATPQGGTEAKVAKVVAPEALVQKTKVKGTARAALPMARKGEITSPKVLAERIRETLKADPTGNKKLVRGANTTPAGFLASVQAAGGTVDGLAALPAYLESLVARDMPSGKFTMSRVHYSIAGGTEKYQLDIEKGFAREAHKGERGWYDANTGRLILAEDCSNSPLGFVKGPTAPQTPAPAPPAQAQACKLPHLVRINIWKAGVLETIPGLKEAVAKERVGTADHFGEEDISRRWGDPLLEAEKLGKAVRSTTPHKVMVTVVGTSGTRMVFDKPVTVTGEHTFRFSQIAEGEVMRLVIHNLDRFHSPTSDLRAAYKEFQIFGCGRRGNLHAIEK